jgi:hypothetical protein
MKPRYVYLIEKEMQHDCPVRICKCNLTPTRYRNIFHQVIGVVYTMKQVRQTVGGMVVRYPFRLTKVRMKG